jgi:imidazolonepropionase-like amidohydrolase
VKRLTICTVILFLAAVPLVASPGDGETDGAPGIALLCGKLITMDKDQTVLNGAVVLIRDGKIEALGEKGDLKIPEGYRVIDGSNRWVIPGMVDFHSHVAGDLGDLNDGVYLTNPDLRTIETLTPNNEHVQDARASGITSMLLIPGSGNNMAGYGTIVKSAGRTPEEIILAAPGVLKISQAGNPERYWYGVGRSFMYWNLRTTLEEMKTYHDAWCAFEEGKSEEKPEYDRVRHKMRGLFRHEYSALIHTQGFQLIMNTMVQLWDNLGIFAVVGHGTFDGYKTAPMLAERNFPVIAGPRNVSLDRQDRRVNGVPAKYWEGGVRILGTNTDSPVLPISEHFYQATIGVHMGWDDTYDALEGLTMAGAIAGCVDKRVGSIEPGKDADIALFTGDPLDPRSCCVLTFVNGKVAYDLAEEGQRF